MSKGMSNVGLAGAPQPPQPPLLFAEHLQHLLDHGLIYCPTHKQPMLLDGLHLHLVNQHGLKMAVWRPLVKYCKTLGATAAALPATVALPPNNSLANPALLLYPNGYSCTLCCLLSINRDVIHKHLHDAHSIYCLAYARHYSQV
jgi:hypothetical protein